MDQRITELLRQLGLMEKLEILLILYWMRLKQKALRLVK